MTKEPYIIGASDYHNMFVLTNPENGKSFFKDIELHTIELKKFASNAKEKLSDLVVKIKTSLDIWAAFLTRYDLLNKNNLPKELNTSSLKKALNVLDVMNFNEEEREAYEEHLKWLRMGTNTLKKSDQKSRVEGKAEGIEEGLRKVAIKMLKENMPVENISRFTGLSIEAIENLAKSS